MHFSQGNQVCMRWSQSLALLTGLALANFVTAQELTKAATQKPDAPSDAELVASLAATLGEKGQGRQFFTSFSALNAKLESADKTANEKTAAAILAKVNDLLPQGPAREAIGLASKNPGKVIAARRLLQLALASSTVKMLGKGKVAFGQLKVEGGKVEPEMVLAQMVIQPDGWFATEIGDPEKTLGFRAANHKELNLELPKGDAFLDLGTVVLKPLSQGESAILKGKIIFEGPDGPKNLQASLNIQMPTSNSPSGGYRPRKKWPPPQTIRFAKDGTFEATGLTPGDQALVFAAGKHEDIRKTIHLKPGTTEDLGTLTMRSTDLGYHLKKEAPKAGKIVWEKDIESARKRALAEGKPLMIMMTATWCGPCKMLEAQTLSDPWVQQFMKEFVVVKAYEDKEVEKQYGLNGYPTLVFTDKVGKELHRTVGYQPTGAFSGQILKACQELNIPADKDLQALAEKGVVKSPPAPQKAPAKLN